MMFFYFFENTDNQHHYYCTKIIPFIGKEKDSETGYCYFGARYYDSDLSGLFLSVDPMADKYPSNSPYAYCAWNPVKLVDPDGRDIWILTDKYNPNAPRVKWTENGLFNEDGSKYEGNDNFVIQTALALTAIYEDNQMLLSQFMDGSEYDVSYLKQVEPHSIMKVLVVRKNMVIRYKKSSQYYLIQPWVWPNVKAMLITKNIWLHTYVYYMNLDMHLMQ